MRRGAIGNRLRGTGNVSLFEHCLVSAALPLDNHSNGGSTARQMERNLFTRHTAELVGIAEHKRGRRLLLIGIR